VVTNAQGLRQHSSVVQLKLSQQLRISPLGIAGTSTVPETAAGKLLFGMQ
jgi:hypothetical protein